MARAKRNEVPFVCEESAYQYVNTIPFRELSRNKLIISASYFKYLNVFAVRRVECPSNIPILFLPLASVFTFHGHTLTYY